MNKTEKVFHLIQCNEWKLQLPEFESAWQLADGNQTLMIKTLNLGTKQHDNESHPYETACSYTQPKNIAFCQFYSYWKLVPISIGNPHLR